MTNNMTGFAPPPRTRRQTTHMSADARKDEIRACIRLGTHDVTAIAFAMGVTKELVYYYAKQMPEIERRAAHTANHRRTTALHLREVAS